MRARRTTPRCPGLSLVLSLLVGALTGTGCDPQGCDGSRYVAGVGVPMITRVELVEQLPDDPWQLVLAVEYEDSDADLDAGFLRLYLGTNTNAKARPLGPFLRQSEVPEGTTAGRFGLAVPLIGNSVQDGVKVRLGLQLDDAHVPRQRSNCYMMDMLFDVSELARLQAERGRRLARQIWPQRQQRSSRSG